MKIFFTNNSTLSNFDHFLSKVDMSDETRLDIFTNQKWVNTHPAGIVFAAALANSVGRESAAIDDNPSSSGAYLARMGLYDFLSTPSHFTDKEHESSGRFIPIQNIKTATDQSRFVTDLTPLLHLDPEKSVAIRYVIGELIRNVIEHAHSPSGAFVAVQYYARKNKISIGICDTGIGLKASLDRFHHPKNDLEAIRLALEPGISGTTFREGGTEQNAGAGLFIVKSLARITRSYFVIYSGDSEYKLLKYDKRVSTPRINADPFDDPHSASDNLPNFNGTLVGIDITLADDAGFNTLMEEIKNVYSKTIRERKGKRYKRFKFI